MVSVVALNMLWTLRVEATVVSNPLGMVRGACVIVQLLSTLLRCLTKSFKGHPLISRGAHGGLEVYPFSMMWVLGYSLWDSLFVCALGSPERAIHVPIALVATLMDAAYGGLLTWDKLDMAAHRYF